MKIIYIVGIIIALAGLAFMVATPNTAPTMDAVSSGEVFFPEPSNFLVDAAEAIPDEREGELNDTLRGIKNGMNVEIAVAIVKTTGGLSPEEYGIKLAEKWAPGDKENDRGILMVIATEDRTFRIETGYGLEGELPDSTLGGIADNYIIPHLKGNDWYSAVNDGALAIAGQLGN